MDEAKLINQASAFHINACLDGSNQKSEVVGGEVGEIVIAVEEESEILQEVLVDNADEHVTILSEKDDDEPVDTEEALAQRAIQVIQERRKPRKCPDVKWIPGTSFTMDAFLYGAIPNCEAYFLRYVLLVREKANRQPLPFRSLWWFDLQV